MLENLNKIGCVSFRNFKKEGPSQDQGSRPGVGPLIRSPRDSVVRERSKSQGWHLQLLSRAFRGRLPPHRGTELSFRPSRYCLWMLSRPI